MIRIQPALLAAALLASACGGPISDADEVSIDEIAQSSFDPVDSFSLARAHAEKFAKDPVAIGLDGVVDSAGKTTWTWTLLGEGRVYVDVRVSPSGARVLRHEVRALMMGQASYEPAKIAVHASDLLHILAQHHRGSPTRMHLSSPLVRNPAPRWMAQCPKGAVFVDAVTGDLQ